MNQCSRDEEIDNFDGLNYDHIYEGDVYDFGIADYTIPKYDRYIWFTKAIKTEQGSVSNFCGWIIFFLEDEFFSLVSKDEKDRCPKNCIFSSVQYNIE